MRFWLDSDVRLTVESLWTKQCMRLLCEALKIVVKPLQYCKLRVSVVKSRKVVE